MKKLTLLMLCIATLGLASCKKDTIINQTTPNRTIVLNVASNAWTLSNQYTYSTTVNVPEIDNVTMNDEGVLVYMSFDNGVTYLPLPFVYDVYSYSTIISNGKVQIDIQSSDLQNRTTTKPTGTVKVKIVIIAAENVT